MTIVRIAFVVLTLTVAGCSASVPIDDMRAKLGAQVLSGQSERAQATEAELLASIVSAYGKDAPITYSVRMLVAESYASWRQADHAMQLANATLADLQAFCQGDEPCSAAGWVSLAQIHVYLHQWVEAEVAADRVATICAGVPITREDPRALPRCGHKAQLALSRLYEELGRYDKASRVYLANDAASHAASRRPRSAFEGIDRATLVGRVYLQFGAYPQASFYLRRCLDESLPRYEPGSNDPSFIASATQGDIATLPFEDTHFFYSQSPPSLEDVIEIHSKLGHDDQAEALSTLQRALWAKGPDLGEALAAKVASAERTSNSPFLTACEGDTLGTYYLGKGQHQQAITAYESALSQLNRITSGQQPSPLLGYPVGLELDLMLGLGTAYEGAVRHTDAERTYRRAIPVATTYLPPGHAWRLETRARLARSLERQHRDDDALAEWQRYLLWANEVRGPDHADYAFGLAGKARALAATGHPRDAAAARDQANRIWAAYNQRVGAITDLPLPAPLLPTPTAAN